MIDSICTDSNWVPHRYRSAVLPLQQSVQLHTVPVRKIMKQTQWLNSKNYNKFFHKIIHFVHKLQIQLLTLSVIKTFLSFAAHVFHTLSSSGGSNIQKTLCIDVRSFHQYIKTERKLSVLSIPSNQVWVITCNRNNKNSIQMY